MAALRTVILDYGQVLCARPEPKVLSRMARVFRSDPQFFLKQYASARGPYDQGLITPEKYWLDLAGSVGARIDSALIEQLRRWDTEMWSKVNPGMTRWVEKLYRAGLTTVVLSNMQIDMVAYARKHFRWLAHVHHQLWSCELGLIKPDLAIFHRCLDHLGIKPKEALFVDDREANVSAAKEAGIVAIRFRSLSQLRSELNKMRFEVLP